MSVQQFRKKPVVIEAMQWEGRINDDNSEVLGWLSVYGVPYRVTVMHELVIPTLEGDMAATPGDWIIRGIKGEFYPCKPEIFAASYEAIESETTT